MNNNLSFEILKYYDEINRNQSDINNKISTFITRANELVELSEGGYQIEKTLKLNKIFLKGFIFESPCCIDLENNNIMEYSIQELKDYLVKYENTFNEDNSKYLLAVDLYELIEDIENLVDSNIDLEINKLSEIAPNIDTIKYMDKSKYQELYFKLKNQLNEYVSNSRLDEQSYNICIMFLNNLFDFYISGYPTIPDEYLYKSDDLE